MNKYHDRHKELQKRNYPISHRINKSSFFLKTLSKKIIIAFLSFTLLIAIIFSLSAKSSNTNIEAQAKGIISFNNPNNNKSNSTESNNKVIVNETQKISIPNEKEILDTPQEYKGEIQDDEFNLTDIVYELQNYDEDEKPHSYGKSNIANKSTKDDKFMYQMFYVDLEEDSFNQTLASKETNGVLQFKNYRIKSNDSIQSIAQRFNLKPDTIISVNELKEDNSLKVGEWLIIPNKNGILHVVQKKETLKKITSTYDKFKTTEKDICIANGIDKNDTLSPGDKIFIPKAKLPESITDKFIAEYAKPVEGVITSMCSWRMNPFTHASWENHPGVDISAPYGSPVRAAKYGTVKYAGWCGGYGNLIIIQHENKLESRYGHLSKINVKVGQQISRKQIVGLIGSTGNSTGPHLHFEVRKDNQVINPTSLTGLKGQKYSRYRF